MTPQEWNAVFVGRSRDILDIVAKEARDILAREGDAAAWRSTHDLAEALYPAGFARGNNINRRQKLYQALMVLAKGSLGDCATRSIKKNKFGHHPWLWHAPKIDFNPETKHPKGFCPHCGGRL